MTSAWTLCALLLTILGSIQGESSELSGRFADQITKLLFGNIWGFDQFCGRKLASKEVAQDDFLYQAFYNGTELGSISRLKDPGKIQKRLQDLIHIGLRARSSLPIICSASSWGYAEERSQWLANTVNDDQTGCWTGLNRMLSSIHELTNRKEVICSQYYNESAGGQDQPELGVTADSDYLLRDWLQLNTFGRVNQGYPYDSHILLGDYNACKRLTQARYCYGGIRSVTWPKKENQEDAEYIRVGMCLPRSCNSKSFANSDELLQVLNQIMREYNNGVEISILNDETMQYKDVYCLPEDESPLRDPIGDTMSTLLMLVAITWLGIVVHTTIFGQSRDEQRSPLNDFSLIHNVKKFFHTKPDSEGLAGLNFIKVFCMFWLVTTHNLQLIVPYLRNLQDFRFTGNSSLLTMILLQGQHAVVTFFLISGFLFGYKYLRGNRNVQFVEIVVSRYTRLAPLYLLVYIYVKKFAHLMSSGPLWDYGVSTQSETRQCMQESWLVPVLMLADFIPPFSHCILTGWHIANDFHISLLLPFLLRIYQRSRRIGKWVVIMSFMVSHLYHVWNFHWQDNFNFLTLSREPLTIGPSTLMKRLANDYVNPIGRFGTYFLGVLLADIILELRSNKDDLAEAKPKDIEMVPVSELKTQAQSKGREPEESQRCVKKFVSNHKDELILTLVFFQLFLCMTAPAQPLSYQDLLGPYSKSFGYPLLRFANELCWFYIIYYILKRQSPIQSDQTKLTTIDRPTESSAERTLLNRFLDLPVWNIANKLNYTIVVIHFTVARYLVQSQTQLINFSWLNLAQMILFNAMITYTLAFVVHLTVEVPLTSIIREISTSATTEQSKIDEVKVNTKSSKTSS